jgi:hypothetical protein
MRCALSVAVGGSNLELHQNSQGVILSEGYASEVPGGSTGTMIPLHISVNAAHLGKPRAASIWSDSDCPRESAQESPDASPAKRVRPLDEGAGGRDAAGRHLDGAAWAMLQRILARLPSPPQLNAPVLQRCCAKW